MKKQENIKELLGMKYEDMAMLLQINLSQWAMYATGKRDLPLNAKLKLVEMLTFLKQKDNKIYGSKESDKMHQLKLAQFYESQKQLNDKQQIIYGKKLSVIEKKYETALTALNFISFLEIKVQKPTNEYQFLLQTIKSNAETEIEKNSLTVQHKLQFKCNLLQNEENFINKKIQSLR